MKKTILAITLLISIISLAQVKPTPAAERMKSVQQRKALQQRSLVNHIPFRNIGPTVMSGRVDDIEVNPADPTEFYVAYATGGLWHTTNNGQSFTSVFDSADVIGIGDIAVNWLTKTIWVGTGEVNSSRSSYAGIGVYKSSNNGKSWQYLGLPESHHIGKIQLHPTDDNIVWVAVLGHLYSANKERGVYKTVDGGKTWKQTLFVNDNTGVVDIDINPSNPGELYAAAWYRTRRAWNFEEGGKTSGIYKSTDGGETWSLITKQGSGFPSGEGIGRIGIAVYPRNPQIVYAVLDNQAHKPDTAQKKVDTSKYVLKDFKGLTREQFLGLDNPKLDTFFKKNRFPNKYNAQLVKQLIEFNKLNPSAIWDYLYDANTALFETPIIGAEIYRSDNGGKSWKKTNQKDLTLYSTYGYYFGKIFVSPVNENKLVITGYDVELSTDGGKTWKKMDKENVHADHHIAWINPNRDSHIIIGNDGGCNITYDNGEHWFKANTPPVGQFYSVAVDMAKPYNVYGGLQDNGSWFGPSNNKEDYSWLDEGNYSFKRLNGGDGMQVQVDWRDNKTVYSGFQFGNYARRSTESVMPEALAKAIEAEVEALKGNTKDEENPEEKETALQAPGDKPLYIHPGNDLGEVALRYNWQTPILLSRHNQDVFYYGSNKFHRSLNRADTLPAISEDLTTNPKQGDVPFGTLSTITESPLKFGLLYAGTDDGNIQVSRDGGYTWTNVSTKLPRGLYVSRLTASAFKEGRVYASLNGYRNDNFLPYLYVSENYGATWKQIGRDLPNEPINVIKEDNKYDSIIYVGTDGGMYVSINAGSSFMGWTNGLPKSVPVHDIVVHPRDNEIVLGTHGRSIYIAKLDSVQLLLNNRVYRNKKQTEAGKVQAFSKPLDNKVAGKNEEGGGVERQPAAAKNK
jgi:photosystem II stability/assembly factor-like uncharacterized protein